MILCIHIENMAVIKSADISFGNGFNVLTGETGAGKSILIDSINLLLGGRTPHSVIRHGENSALVSGLFVVPKSRMSLFNELGVTPEEDGSVLISREIFADGRNICRINGKISTVSVLKEIGGHLITIHGQHDNQLILDPKTHIDFLDLFVGQNENFCEIKATYKEKYSSLLAKKRELSEISTDEDEKLRKLDLLSYEIDELKKADLKEGEEEELKSRRNIIVSAQELIKNLTGAHYMLYEGDEGNAYSLALSACEKIDEAAEIDPALSELYETLNESIIGIREVSRSLSHYIDNFDGAEDNLEEIEARLDVIFKMKRKYGGTVISAIATLDRLTEEFESIEASDERINILQHEIEVLEKACYDLAKKMHSSRKNYASVLIKDINDSLEFLDMSGAEFDISFSDSPLNSNGTDVVEFIISTNKGEPKKPLSKIVSGGELSRIMLAIKTILPKSEAEPSMIFDEIDTGVSGRAAQKIAVKLASLSKENQILCVTHLAHIAAAADTHFSISKREVDGKTFTDVTPLDFGGRVLEIARIIGGDNVSETTIKQAEEMLTR